MKKLLNVVLAGLLLALVVVPVAAGGHGQESAVYRFVDGSEVDGSTSTLLRNGNGVTMTLRTSDLEPGAAYTMWWVVFNDPDQCKYPAPFPGAKCGEGDIFLAPEVPNLEQIEAAKIWVGRAAGHVIGMNSVGAFAGHLSVGDTSEMILGFPGGLINPEGAEIHLVVRSHGEPIPGEVADQIHTVGGGCDTNVCVDNQFTIHLAPQP